MRKATSFSLVVAMILTGCATAYQPQGFTGGFTETQLDENVWKVAFKGNGYTGGERAEDFAMLRSAELTLANGYQYFAFADSRSSERISAVSSPTTSTTTGNAYRFGGSTSFNATTTTYGGDTAFVSKPSTVNTVVMFKEKPDVRGMVFSAAFICHSLGKKYEVVCGAPRK